MDGKVVAVTGATSGLGMAAAAGFARLGATVWLVVRNAERGEFTRVRLVQESGSDAFHVGLCDLSDLGSVRRFADELVNRGGRLDVLVNNAGMLAAERRYSPDGIELTLATNVVGPYLLTGLLAPSMQQSAPARVITVASGGMYTARLDLDSLLGASEPFRGAAAYAQTKRIEVILNEMWAQRHRGTDITFHAMHPGWVDTPGLREALPSFYRMMRRALRNPSQGADTIVWLGSAAAPGQLSGAFWFDRARRPTHLLPRTRETAAERERLWAEIGRLSQIDEPVVP
jgi:NAD(P)-dependent dehydrogenase (short-subunit alcohol dehydrogenase family)